MIVVFGSVRRAAAANLAAPRPPRATFAPLHTHQRPYAPAGPEGQRRNSGGSPEAASLYLSGLFHAPSR